MQRIKLPQINGIGDNQTGTIKLPMGYTYRRIYLHHQKLKMSEINAIRVVANGNVIQTFPTGTDLCLLNYLFGLNPTFPNQSYGVTGLHFDFPKRRTRLAEEQYSLVTGFRPEGYIGDTVRNAAIEIEFGTISDNNPKLEAYAVVWNNPPAKHSGMCAQMYHYPQYNAGAAGKFIIDDLPRQIKWSDIIIKPSAGKAPNDPDQPYLTDGLLSTAGSSEQEKAINSNVKSAKLSIGNIIIWESDHRTNQAVIREEGHYNTDPFIKTYSDDVYSNGGTLAPVTAAKFKTQTVGDFALLPGQLFPINLGSEYGYGGEGIIAGRTGVNISMELDLVAADASMSVFVHGFGPIR